jgi:hypothetical protein
MVLQNNLIDERSHGANTEPVLPSNQQPQQPSTLPAGTQELVQQLYGPRIDAQHEIDLAFQLVPLLVRPGLTEGEAAWVREVFAVMLWNIETATDSK